MSATQYQKVLEKELIKLNKKIDILILKGRSYSAEARRHREIRFELNRVKQTVGVFGRLFSHATSY